MFRYLRRISGPIIPILYVDSNINQIKTSNLLKKLKSHKYNFAKGIAIVCSIQNNMPVQIDKILQQVKRIKQTHNIPVYGFLLDQCTPQNYYIASISNQIYSLPSTIFQLQREQEKLNLKQSLQNIMNLQTTTFQSKNNINSSQYDKYFNIMPIILNSNNKSTHISNRIYQQAIRQRISNFWYDMQLKKKLTNNISKQLPARSFLGQQAIELGLIDNIGQHFDILTKKHPDCYLHVIKFTQQPRSIKKSLAILTSPLLLALFIFKVIAKWSLIMYVWFTSNKKNQVTNSS